MASQRRIGLVLAWSIAACLPSISRAAEPVQPRAQCDKPAESEVLRKFEASIGVQGIRKVIGADGKVTVDPKLYVLVSESSKDLMVLEYLVCSAWLQGRVTTTAQENCLRQQLVFASSHPKTEDILKARFPACEPIKETAKLPTHTKADTKKASKPAIDAGASATACEIPLAAAQGLHDIKGGTRGAYSAKLIVNDTNGTVTLNIEIENNCTINIHHGVGWVNLIVDNETVWTSPRVTTPVADKAPFIGPHHKESGGASWTLPDEVRRKVCSGTQRILQAIVVPNDEIC